VFPSETELETDLLFLIQFLTGTDLLFPSKTGQRNMTPVQSVYETVLWERLLHSFGGQSLIDVAC
jgi:hypothetical protein